MVPLVHTKLKDKEEDLLQQSNYLGVEESQESSKQNDDAVRDFNLNSDSMQSQGIINHQINQEATYQVKVDDIQFSYKQKSSPTMKEKSDRDLLSASKAAQASSALKMVDKSETFTFEQKDNI